MKKIIVITLALLFASAGIVMAAGNAKPKTTGDVGFSVPDGRQINLVFNAFEDDTVCSTEWNVNGNWGVTFQYLGGLYQHDFSVEQDGSSLNATGGYPFGADPQTYTWHTTFGDISGNAVNFTMVYDTGAEGTTMDMTGTIQPDGSITGTWNDNFGGDREGTWSASAGTAVKSATGCTGHGQFYYSDNNGDWYNATVQFVNVEGDNAVFGALVTESNQPWVGNWALIKVHDGGEPAIDVDHVWGAFVSEDAARIGVADLNVPSPEFSVNEGNLQVH